MTTLEYSDDAGHCWRTAVTAGRVQDSRYSGARTLEDLHFLPVTAVTIVTAVTAGRVPSRTSTSSPSSESSTKHLQREGKMLQKSRRLGEWDGRVGSQESGGSGVAAEG